MQFYSNIECDEWLSGQGRAKPDTANKRAALRLSYPSKPYRVFPWAHWIATSLTYQQPCLLWITEWDIWASTENLHLYYRLRQSYGDFRMLHEMPRHLFLKHEAADLATFLQVVMLNGWGGYILTAYDYVNAFFSHDEFIDFYSDQTSLIDEIKNSLSDGLPADKQV